MNVLFLCTGNSARSQMAEAFVRAKAPGSVVPYSAGLQPAGVNPLTERVMAEIGISMEGQRSKSVSEYLGKMHFGYVISVCHSAEQQCAHLFPGVGKRLHWDIPDPAAVEGTEEEKLAAFRQARDEIERRVSEWLNTI